jgi:hypothetical protein
MDPFLLLFLYHHICPRPIAPTPFSSMWSFYRPLSPSNYGCQSDSPMSSNHNEPDPTHTHTQTHSRTRTQADAISSPCPSPTIPSPRTSPPPPLVYFTPTAPFINLFIPSSLSHNQHPHQPLHQRQRQHQHDRRYFQPISSPSQTTPARFASAHHTRTDLPHVHFDCHHTLTQMHDPGILIDRLPISPSSTIILTPPLPLSSSRPSIDVDDETFTPVSDPSSYRAYLRVTESCAHRSPPSRSLHHLITYTHTPQPQPQPHYGSYDNAYTPPSPLFYIAKTAITPTTSRTMPKAATKEKPVKAEKAKRAKKDPNAPKR